MPLPSRVQMLHPTCEGAGGGAWAGIGAALHLLYHLLEVLVRLGDDLEAGWDEERLRAGGRGSFRATGGGTGLGLQVIG